MAATALFLALALAAPQEGDDPFADDTLFDDGLDALLSDVLGEEVPAGDATPKSVFEDAKGWVELRGRWYTAGDAPGNDAEYWLEGELELEFDVASRTEAYLRPRVRVSAKDSDANEFELFEAYLTHTGDDWDLRAGQFVENWGIVDTFNPIDVVNRRDLVSDFLDADRLGEAGVRWRRFWDGNATFGEPTLSLYALPIWRRTPFPTDESRWSFASLGASFDEDGGESPEGFENAFFASRLQSTLSTEPANADLQLLVARGPERTPIIAPSGAGFAPFYYGANVFGGGLRMVPNSDAMGAFLATLTFKAEVAYKVPYRFDDATLPAPDRYLQYVVGVDRLFPNLFLDGDQLTATVEYAGEFGAADTDPAALLRPFRSDFVLRAFWEQNDFARTSLEARAIVDTELSESVYEVIFERQLRQIHEDLKLVCSVQVFDADDPRGLFSRLPDNTNATVRLRYEL